MLFKVLELLPLLITSIATAIATLGGRHVYVKQRDKNRPKCPMCNQSLRPPPPRGRDR